MCVFFCLFFTCIQRVFAQGRIATYAGILPEHLNRGHTGGSSPSHPPGGAWLIFIARRYSCFFPLCTHAQQSHAVDSAICYYTSCKREP